MRCVSCNRMLTQNERVSFKIMFDEDHPESFVSTGEYEDMCNRCKGKLKECYNYNNREYAHEELTEGITIQPKMSDYL